MTDNLRIALIGQAAFGESVLKALLDSGKNVVAVFCPPDKEGRSEDPLKTATTERGVPVFQFKRMRDREAIDAFREQNADLGVMAFVTDIVPAETLEAPAKGTINFHPSLLPKHRGPSSMNWPIIQGETKTGLTIFWPDAGLDTGPILMQKEVDILPDDTLGTLYFDKIFPLGVEAIVESVELIEKGEAPRIEQDESQATYESWCKSEHVAIDWNAPVDDVYNLIRGGDPSPGANTTYEGAPVKVFKAAKIVKAVDAAPGTVVTVDDQIFSVAATGGAIRIGRVQPEGSKKLPAAEWTAAVGLQQGDRLGA